jgi:hypothetical protein
MFLLLSCKRVISVLERWDDSDALEEEMKSLVD